MSDTPIPVVARLYSVTRGNKTIRRASVLDGEGEPLVLLSDAKARLDASTAKVSALQDRVKELESDAAAKQAKIDQLMLEYCPKDMTPEQIEEWGKNQQVSSTKENTNG